MDPGPFINLFNGKPRVTFIHATTGKLIGVRKMKPDQLPLAFNKPVNIELEGVAWRVMKAEPINAKEFLVANKLTLHVQEASSVDPNVVGTDIPTICNDWPQTAPGSLFNDFTLNIRKNQWRQLEFLPASLLEVVKEEMMQVETVLFPGEKINTLAGYGNMYIRKNIPREPLTISLDEFCERLQIRGKGALQFSENDFVYNGFALRSDNYTYYGIVNDGLIVELSLDVFESVDEEFCEGASIFDLVLADWCNGKIVMG